MHSFTLGIAICGAAGLLGAMLFFSAVIAPLIFTRLPADEAGRLIRAIFPWYYLVILLMSAVAALAIAGGRPIEALLLAVVFLGAAIARQRLMPAINAASDAIRDGNEAAQPTFQRLHRLSVWINAGQMIALAVVLARLIPPAG